MMGRSAPSITLEMKHETELGVADTRESCDSVGPQQAGEMGS